VTTTLTRDGDITVKNITELCQHQMVRTIITFHEPNGDIEPKRLDASFFMQDRSLFGEIANMPFRITSNDEWLKKLQEIEIVRTEANIILEGKDLTLSAVKEAVKKILAGKPHCYVYACMMGKKENTVALTIDEDEVIFWCEEIDKKILLWHFHIAVGVESMEFFRCGQ